MNYLGTPQKYYRIDQMNSSTSPNELISIFQNASIGAAVITHFLAGYVNQTHILTCDTEHLNGYSLPRTISLAHNLLKRHILTKRSHKTVSEWADLCFELCIVDVLPLDFHKLNF